MRINKYIYITLFAGLMLCSCNSSKKTSNETEETQQALGPTFNADSAMEFCKEQCDFGPRTMNSKAHDLCETWIQKKFEQYGTTVELQKADLTGWDGKTLKSTNIIARINPEAQRRILICAHWDSRPWADNDPDSTNWHKPVMAANDAASGVAVMLELARLLQKDTTIAFGVDFVCFDAEDYGAPQWKESQPGDEDTWALGAQYYAKNLSQDNKPQYGILLDMVGGVGSKFYQERYSMKYAANIVDNVWAASKTVGQGSFFIDEQGGFITDDHDPVNKAGVPTIDIIPYYKDCEQSSFGPTWHTVNDDMAHLDKNVLFAVGQTLIQVLYQEK